MIGNVRLAFADISFQFGQTSSIRDACNFIGGSDNLPSVEYREPISSFRFNDYEIRCLSTFIGSLMPRRIEPASRVLGESRETRKETRDFMPARSSASRERLRRSASRSPRSERRTVTLYITRRRDITLLCHFRSRCKNRSRAILRGVRNGLEASTATRNDSALRVTRRKCCRNAANGARCSRRCDKCTLWSY